ncbi:hypothetical protein B0J11DRAFT_593352 [Dendryphion nanum]|uniref:Xylanolytic transcriptional activator regulatory domain-containing protein n=1 Tax=Dendryphion nanum TaxID=256645 RepID=A0A9P9DE94_9PLEO|nr:hypothetical protein B0J11DRAFT_593352 [Dendryphion nanum]
MEGSRVTAVRCDRQLPCSPCRLTGQTCAFTGLGQKPKEPRQRVHITSRHEHKIDSIDERLKAIECLLLEDRARSKQGGQTDSPGLLVPPRTSSHHTANVFDQDDVATGTEGSSSLQAHAEIAQNLANTIMNLESVDSPSLPINFQTSSLSPQRVSGGTHNESQPQVPGAPSSSCHRTMELPPMPAIVDILKRVKEEPSISFIALRCFTPIEHFIDTCRNVFFAIDDYSDVEFIIATAGLYYLFTEIFQTTAPGPSRRQFLAHGHLCRKALEAALSTVGAFLPARMDSVQALILGSCHAIEISKPWLAWRMAGFAAQLCQTMGWQDDAIVSEGEETMKSTKFLLFWHAYIIERALSFRLGRASVIRDCDITISSRLNGIAFPEPWPGLFSFWVGHANIQGKVYELLYSKAALSWPEASLLAHSEELLAALQSLGLQNKDIFESNPIEKCTLTSGQFLALTNKVTYYCAATLISRAKTLKDPSFTFSLDCLDFARKTLQAHEECMQLTAENHHYRSIYVHWRILQLPFIPFIVVFGSIVKTCNLEDLSRLHGFVDSLQSLTHLSPPVYRLHRISQALYEVACLYLDRLSSEEQRVALSIGSSGYEQMTAEVMSMFYGDNPLGRGYDLGSLLCPPMDECFFGPQQVLGSLQLPSPTNLPSNVQHN